MPRFLSIKANRVVITYPGDVPNLDKTYIAKDPDFNGFVVFRAEANPANAGTVDITKSGSSIVTDPWTLQPGGEAFDTGDLVPPGDVRIENFTLDFTNAVAGDEIILQYFY